MKPNRFPAPLFTNVQKDAKSEMFVSDHQVPFPSWESIRLLWICNFLEALSLLIGMCLASACTLHSDSDGKLANEAV